MDLHSATAWIQWGNVPSWVGFAGTTVGLFLTGKALRRQNRNFEEQHVRRVNVYAEFHSSEPIQEGTRDTWSIVVENCGGDPVPKATPTWTTPVGYDDSGDEQQLPPMRVKAENEVRWTVVADRRGRSSLHGTPDVSVRIQDIEGRHWIRRDNGKLSRIEWWV